MAGCLSSLCRYVTDHRGQHHNGRCRCDDCPGCGGMIRPSRLETHYEWCPTPSWIPPHHSPTDYDLAELWLVRHGESTANAGGRGETPSGTPLTDLGRRQATEVAGTLMSLAPRPHRVVTSSFLRTSQTAEPYLKALGLEANLWPVEEWIFLDPSKYEGTTWAERRGVVKEYGDRADPDYRDGPAESFNTFMVRVGIVFEFARAWGGRTVAFTHGRFIRGAMWWLKNVQEGHNRISDPFTPSNPYRFTPEQFRNFWEFSESTEIPNCHVLKIVFRGSTWSAV